MRLYVLLALVLFTIPVVGQDSSQAQPNNVWAGPSVAPAGKAKFRLLIPADIPSLPSSIITSGVFNTARLGTGTASSSTWLRGDGAWTALPAGVITSVFGRTGVVVAATNDYTWAQIDKTTSSLADITTRSAADLSSGTLLAARMPALTGDVTTSAGAVATTIGAGKVTNSMLAGSIDLTTKVTGILPNASFPATLPAASGVNLTALNASNLASGTAAIARGGTGTGTAFTADSVVFAGASGVYTQDNANFSYDATNHFLQLQRDVEALRIGTTASSQYYSIGRDGTEGYLVFSGKQQTFSGYDFRIFPGGGSVGTSALTIRREFGFVGIGTASPTSPLQVVGLPVYANNAAALAGGLTAGAFYRNGSDPDLVCVVH